MSHELEDNIERRKRIIQTMTTEGISEEDFLIHVMNFGYNVRGAREKVRELFRLNMVIRKSGKLYPVRTIVRTRAQGVQQAKDQEPRKEDISQRDKE